MAQDVQVETKHFKLCFIESSQGAQTCLWFGLNIFYSSQDMIKDRAEQEAMFSPLLLMGSSGLSSYPEICESMC